MGGKMDKVKGRLKETACDLLDEPQLKREGKKDRAKGSIKEGIDKVADKMQEALDKGGHSRKRTVNTDSA